MAMDLHAPSTSPILAITAATKAVQEGGGFTEAMVKHLVVQLVVQAATTPGDSVGTRFMPKGTAAKYIGRATTKRVSIGYYKDIQVRSQSPAIDTSPIRGTTIIWHGLIQNEGHKRRTCIRHEHGLNVH